MPSAVFSIVFALSLSVTVAAAQPAHPEYQNLVEQGLHEFGVGNFAEAKAFFQQAHQLSPSARTLRGLGMVSYELRHYVEAIDLFQQALASEQRPLTAEMHREVSQLLRQALSFVTRLELSVSPQQAQLHLDTRDVSRDAAGKILLDPGEHELTVEAHGYEAVTRTLRSDGAEALTLSIRLPETNQTLAITSAPSPADASLASESGSVGPYVLMGGSAALAVAGGTLLAIALNHKHTVENAEQSAANGPRYADYQSRADSVLPLSAAGISALCAGGVGVVAGLIWKLTTGGSQRAKDPGTRLTTTGTTITLQSRFP